MPEYGCKRCNFTTVHKKELQTHLETKKHVRFGIDKKALLYTCNCCKFETHDRTKYVKHLDTGRHKINFEKVYVPNVFSDLKNNVLEQLKKNYAI